MDIAGVEVLAKPEDLPGIEVTIGAMPQAEVHAVRGDGRLVVIVEAEDYQKTSEAVLALHQIKGVLAATLVYQHSEEDC